jgi:hypothetical protein
MCQLLQKPIGLTIFSGSNDINYIYQSIKILTPDFGGQLQRLQCPFEVMVIQDVGELYRGLICLDSAVKIDLTLIDVYIMRDKAYYFFNFRVLGRK